MDLTSVAKAVEKFTIDNSPTILTVVGVTGTVTTALLTGKATFKAAEILAYEKAEDIDELIEFFPDLKIKVGLVWKEYIPPVVVGSATIACIIGANAIGTRRAAALAAAYSLSEKAFADYKDKVVEKLGEKKEQAVRDEVASDQIRKNPVGSREVIMLGVGEVLCFEQFTARYFMSSVEELRKAMNDLNETINHDGYASLGDFYARIGLPRTSYSEEVGWTSDKLFEINFSACLAEDGRPCVAVDYAVLPVRAYYKIN